MFSNITISNSMGSLVTMACNFFIMDFDTRSRVDNGIPPQAVQRTSRSDKSSESILPLPLKPTPSERGDLIDSREYHHTLRMATSTAGDSTLGTLPLHALRILSSILLSSTASNAMSMLQNSCWSLHHSLNVSGTPALERMASNCLLIAVNTITQ